jgi:hypothetical protein
MCRFQSGIVEQAPLLGRPERYYLEGCIDVSLPEKYVQCGLQIRGLLSSLRFYATTSSRALRISAQFGLIPPKQNHPMLRKNLYYVAALVLFLGACGGTTTPTTTTDQTDLNADTSTSQSAKPSESLEEIGLTGSYYCVNTREMLLLYWEGGLQKVFYYDGKGGDQFQTLVVQKPKGLDAVAYSCFLAENDKTQPRFKLVSGVSPVGVSLTLMAPDGSGAAEEFALIDEQPPPAFDDSNVRPSFFVRNIYWRAFVNASNMARLAAEDSQEGTNSDQLHFGYTDPAGQEEFFSAYIDAKTHELRFESTSMGKVSARLGYLMPTWQVVLYNAQKQQIGTFSEDLETARE